ncbi:MAG TPA: insulinase family protein [Terriglobia bacterium]|jgi:zinc protease
MTNRKYLPLIVLCLASLAVAAGFSAAPQADLNQPIPVDPTISIGHLSNGVTYYVRANKKPEKRAELRLVVKAGSVLEDDDQQGLAHFIEHMAFNGTSHFPKNDIISFIESLGMRFGADLNAYTSFDETVYMLQVPTDKPETMDKAIQVLEDWAHNVSFDPVEVEKERPVIMEEWRLRRGAGARIQDKLLPIVLKDSRYADRLPIGKTEIIQNAKVDMLKRFYKDWYRPELMAVVAVGDFDKGAVENLIKNHFNAIPASTSPKARPTFDVPDRKGSVYAILSDKELTSTSVEIENILPHRQEGTVGVYRQDIVDGLFTGMLDERFAEITQKPGAPFLAASVDRSPFVAKTKDEADLGARVKDDGIEKGLEAVLTEVDRVERFGFTQTELDREKTDVLRAYERMVIEDQNRESNDRADEYIRNFLTAEPLPGAEREQALHLQFVPQITLAEVNAIAKQWFTDTNRIVTVTAPEKTGVALPDEAKIAAVIKGAGGKDIKAYVDTVSTAALLDPLPSPGTVTKTMTLGALGITEWDLSNGVKVILKPTNFREDEILFRATRPGGTSLASDADFIPASTAVQLVSAGGVGPFNRVDLSKALTGKVASAGAFIGETTEGFSGNASRKDLETMFQLAYLRFMKPRADADAFTVQSNQARIALANQTAAPGYAFADTLNTILGGNHPRRQMPKATDVDKWNLDKSLAFYKERFADASGFTFVFVGSFDLATMKPLVERYIASLPSLNQTHAFKDVGVKLPAGVIEKRVEKGIEPKSQTAIVFTGPFDFDPAHRTAIRAMSQILQTRLLESIREELGGTYSISASASTDKYPRTEYELAIQFGSDPQRTDELVKQVFTEIDKLKTQGPTAKQVADEKEALLREFETNSKENGYLLSQLVGKIQYGEDIAGVWNAPELYKSLDAATIQDAAKKYLNTGDFVRVSLFPEQK